MTPGGIRMGTPALTSRYVLFVCIFMLLSVVALQVAFLANRALAIEFVLQFLTFVLFCRGLTEEDFEKVAHFFDRAVTITENINAKTGPKVRESLYVKS